MGALGEGDPAARAGLEDGDRILSIDGESSESMSFADVMQHLRGEPKTTVGVSVMRPSTGQVLDVMLERAIIVR
jgi:carboxyl-terminal processing protease